MSTEEIKETVKSDDGYSEVPSPVEGEGGKVKDRKADVKADAENEDAVKSEEFTAEEVIDSLDLDEEVKNKIKVVFEAAVLEEVEKRLQEATADIAEQASESIASIKEEYDSKVTTATEAVIEEMTMAIEEFMDRVAEKWLEENTVAIEAGVKVERAERLLEGMKAVFSEANVILEDGEMSVAEEISNDLDETREALSEAIAENVELMTTVNELRAAAAFREISEGMTTSQVSRLKVISEKLDVSDIDEYVADLNTIKETFFKKTNKSEAVVEEIVDDTPVVSESVENVDTDDLVSLYSNAFKNRTF